MPGYHERMYKVFCLAQGLRGMYDGNHESRSIPRILARYENIYVYHNPIRSYSQFERKVVQGHCAAVKASFTASTAWHWSEFYQAWESGCLPQVYAELASRNRISHDNIMANLFRGDLKSSDEVGSPSGTEHIQLT